MRQLGPKFVTAVRSLILACLGLGLVAAGPTQPQTVTGPCHVKDFFIVSFGTSNTDMTVDGGPQACQFTLFNPALDRFQTAALITTLPSHGHAEAGLILGGTSAAVSYTPEPGYTGADTFTATIEPSDKAVIVHVTVAKPGLGKPG